MSRRLLTAKGLVVSYLDGPQVLDDADLQVRVPGRLALLGANGSGKTTLLRCLSGALEPARGHVVLDAQRLTYGRAALRRHRQQVQLVLQDPDDQLFSADVRRDVAYGPLNLELEPDEVTERVDEALYLLGVEHLAARPVHRLSYGERKRVTIAGAVAMRPDILLLDEPSAGLDPVGVEEMFTALAQLEERGTAVVLSTHDVALALDWADTVALAVAGTVVQGDTTTLLGDADLLARVRLAVPWPLDLAAKLAESGLIATDRRPRNLDEVHRALTERSVDQNCATKRRAG